jgi:hypothetical protein
VKVSLTQEVSKPAQVAKPAAKAKKSTITCIKGKISKKVSGSKPLCPAGFKKK